MKYVNDPKLVQHKFMPLRTLLGQMPRETGNAQADVHALRGYVEQLVGSLEYMLEHLTLQQFADGELEKIGGVKNG